MSQKDFAMILIAALKKHAPDKKPTVKELAEWTGAEKVTGEDATAAWNQYQEELNDAEEIEGVFVKAAPGVGSFRRAGFNFDETGMGIALDVLTEDQLDALEDEKRLIVEYCTFPAGKNVISE